MKYLITEIVQVGYSFLSFYSFVLFLLYYFLFLQRGASVLSSHVGIVWKLFDAFDVDVSSEQVLDVCENTALVTCDFIAIFESTCLFL